MQNSRGLPTTSAPSGRATCGAVAVGLTGLIAACGPELAPAGPSQPDPHALFGPAIAEVALEVDYATGAAPYTGTTRQGEEAWALFRGNAERLFARADKVLEVPTTLDEMEELSEVTGDAFTVEAILEIAEQHRDRPCTEKRATFYAIWLPGYLEHEGEVRQDVLGVSIGDTGVIAMFKPVIATSHRDAVPAISRFVEQSTLIHEFGHAVGLVNRGVPMATDHEDPDHAAHCHNDGCAMYWANEGVGDLIEFVQRYVASAQTVLFDDDCLADVDALVQSLTPR